MRGMKNLLDVIRERNMNKVQAAQACKMSLTSFIRIASNKCSPTLRNMRRISKGLGIPIEELAPILKHSKG
jgi:DNA-binding phage protein